MRIGAPAIPCVRVSALRNHKISWQAVQRILLDEYGHIWQLRYLQEADRRYRAGECKRPGVPARDAYELRQSGLMWKQVSYKLYEKYGVEWRPDVLPLQVMNFARRMNLPFVEKDRSATRTRKPKVRRQTHYQVEW